MDAGNHKQPVEEDGPEAATNEQVSAGLKKPALWTRRRLLTSIVSLAAGVITVRFWPFGLGDSAPKNSEAKRRDKPRFKRKKTPVMSAVVNLSTGFYFRDVMDRGSKPKEGRKKGPKRKIIHYVDSQHRALFVSDFSEFRAQPANEAQMSLKDENVRVHLDRASVSFEIAAVDQVLQGKNDEACKLLLDGIKHDLMSKKNNRGLPSLRLFDLLAKIATRTNDKENMDALLEISKSATNLFEAYRPDLPAARAKKGGKKKRDDLKRKRLPTEIFADRIHKWSDPNSDWRRKLLDANQQVWWKLTISPDTTKGNPVKKTIEIKFVGGPQNNKAG